MRSTLWTDRGVWRYGPGPSGTGSGRHGPWSAYRTPAAACTRNTCHTSSSPSSRPRRSGGASDLAWPSASPSSSSTAERYGPRAPASGEVPPWSSSYPWNHEPESASLDEWRHASPHRGRRGDAPLRDGEPSQGVRALRGVRSERRGRAGAHRREGLRRDAPGSQDGGHRRFGGTPAPERDRPSVRGRGAHRAAGLRRLRGSHEAWRVPLLAEANGAGADRRDALACGGARWATARERGTPAHAGASENAGLRWRKRRDPGGPRARPEGGRERLQGGHSRRVRHREGSRGAANTRSEPEAAESVPRRALWSDGTRASRERAVRTRTWCVHRSRGREARAVRAGRRRNAVSRRVRRDVTRDAIEAPESA